MSRFMDIGFYGCGTLLRGHRAACDFHSSVYGMIERTKTYCISASLGFFDSHAGEKPSSGRPLDTRLPAHNIWAPRIGLVASPASEANGLSDVDPPRDWNNTPA